MCIHINIFHNHNLNYRDCEWIQNIQIAQKKSSSVLENNTKEQKGMNQFIFLIYNNFTKNEWHLWWKSREWLCNDWFMVKSFCYNAHNIRIYLFWHKEETTIIQDWVVYHLSGSYVFSSDLKCFLTQSIDFYLVSWNNSRRYRFSFYTNPYRESNRE